MDLDTLTERRWSATIPAVPGYYWWREGPGNARIVLVSSTGMVYDQYHGEPVSVMRMGGEWYGPLQPPE